MRCSLGAQTTRRSLKTIAMNFPAGSIERVYLHGKWQQERGRQPTLVYGNHTDARRAFKSSVEFVGPYIESVRALPFSRQHEWGDWVPDIMNRVPVSALSLPD